MKIAVTGHRPETLGKGPGLPLLISRVQSALWAWMGAHPALYITGGARGTDQWAAEEALHRDYPYWVYLPFPVPVFAARWDATDRRTLEDLVTHAAKVTRALDEYHVRGYHMRDRAMVDDADEVLAVWDGRETGGTAATVQYARTVGKPVHVLDPRGCR